MYEEDEKNMKKKTVAGLITIVAIAAVVMLMGCIEEEPSTSKATPPEYSFSIYTNDDIVNLTITKIKEGDTPDTLSVGLWKNRSGSLYTTGFGFPKKVEIEDKEIITLNPGSIGDFSGEYVVRVEQDHDSFTEKELFNESVVLKPKGIKLGDGMAVRSIEVIPVSTTYIEYNPKFTAPYYREHPVEAKEGYNFLVIELTGKNIGNKESFANVYGATLKTTKGYFYHAYNYPSSVARFLDVLPGEEEPDYLVFEIPRDQRGVEVYFKIESEERILKLQ